MTTPAMDIQSAVEILNRLAYDDRTDWHVVNDHDGNAYSVRSTGGPWHTIEAADALIIARYYADREQQSNVEFLCERLQNPDEVLGYLEAAHEERDMQVMRLAVKDVIAVLVEGMKQPDIPAPCTCPSCAVHGQVPREGHTVALTEAAGGLDLEAIEVRIADWPLSIGLIKRDIPALIAEVRRLQGVQAKHVRLESKDWKYGSVEDLLGPAIPPHDHHNHHPGADDKCVTCGVDMSGLRVEALCSDDLDGEAIDRANQPPK